VTVSVRHATADDHDDVRFLLDSAMLEVDATALEDRIDAESVLVAEVGREPVGVCVFDGGEARTEIEQIAVRRSRRGRGIGRTLVEFVADDGDGAVTAEFREQVKPFYESLGFEIRKTESGRLRGVLR
jgi:ribosomal protein S18 acetylase RimI-like enzyme